MKSFIINILEVVFGKKIFYNFFRKLFKFSLRGMNFGMSEAEKDGEINIIKKFKVYDKIPIIFDVGANRGQYANLINSVFNGKAKIYSFEPSKETYSILEKNTANISNIKIFNFGFGSENKNLYLNYDQSGSGLASVYKRRLDHFNIYLNKKEEISLKKIDDFCNENKIENIDLLKMDVEGFELEVLKGAYKMLEGRKIKSIQFEFGGCNIDSRTFFQDFYYLLKDNYKIYRILKDGQIEIKKYTEDQEIFITVNYYCELK